MKNKFLIVLLSTILLSSCGDNDVIRTNVTSPNDNSFDTTITSDDVASSITGGIYSKKLEDILTNIKDNTIYNIKRSSSSYVHLNKDNDKNEVFSLNIDTKLFANSVLTRSINAKTTNDYQYFSYYDENYGKKVNEYVYVDDNFKNIISRNEFVNKENKKEVTEKSEVYTLKNYDEHFLIFDPLTFSNNIEDYALAGYIDDVLFVRQISTSKHNVDDTMTTYTDYYIEDNKINRKEIYVEISDGNNLLEQEKISSLYYYQDNGNYDKNIIPQIGE